MRKSGILNNVIRLITNSPILILSLWDLET